MIRFSIPVASLLALAACSNQPLDATNPDFGDAVRHNMAVQILPIEKPADTGTPTPMPGARANVGMDRYMKGKVLKPPSGTSFNSPLSNGGANNGNGQ